ncbi:MAG: hypothetical protein ABFD90_07625 [Phycisphaerales bacterium]
MAGRTTLSRIQTGLFLLCSVTYAVALVYFWAVLPCMIHTQVDQRGDPMLYTGKNLFMVVYTILVLALLPIQLSERLRAVPAPRLLSSLCRSMNEQASRLGPFNNPHVWRWIALAGYASILLVFLSICVGNYKRMGA